MTLDIIQFTFDQRKPDKKYVWQSWMEFVVSGFLDQFKRQSQYLAGPWRSKCG